jgi:hypothetical protein
MRWLTRILLVVFVALGLAGCLAIPAPPPPGPGLAPPPPPRVLATPQCGWRYGVGWYGWGWYGAC